MYIWKVQKKKISEKVFCFGDNGIWACCWNFSQLWPEQMWSAVKVLAVNSKISGLTKKDVF